MRLVPLEIESKLRDRALWPESWTARAAVYVLSLDILLFALQQASAPFNKKVAGSMGGWVTFLSGLAIVLFIFVGFRWARAQLLWRLRNRLIVTYVFIGVIPVVLLVLLSSLTLYLLAGQFANFVVLSEINTHLRSMQAANKAIASELALQASASGGLAAESMAGMRSHDPDWARRQVCAWSGNGQLQACAGPVGMAAFEAPGFVKGEDFGEIVRDQGALYLRTATLEDTRVVPLQVVSSEPLDRSFIEEIAANLGEITLYIQTPTQAQQNKSDQALALQGQNDQGFVISRNAQPGLSVNAQNQPLIPVFTAGTVPAGTGFFDRQITFATPLPVVDWASGGRQSSGAVVRIDTRTSVLYSQLFSSLVDFAKAIESVLFFILIVLVLIELLALTIGVRLTRSITASVAQLYDATTHINRGDFSHRIKVTSNDQLATLATSFNSMTASIEKLVLEQKEKQRLENELVIAQEVQEQLFPKRISQLESLEVHGFCRPARTVSGDYYDFLCLNADKMIVAVGDVSGKGISAALLMATIHSAVRAYSLEGVPLLRLPNAIGAVAGSGLVLAAETQGAEVSPAYLLTLLNQQLYESTPREKYATLFLGIYDGLTREFTYCNGGHLPPILISQDGSSEMLSNGGTVIGLFDKMEYPDATVQLREGDIFLAYSDGVTEPENEYGEFGEQRLIEIVRDNRHLPLERITELVVAAVDDWIGEHEQPDDVTLVLARAR